LEFLFVHERVLVSALVLTGESVVGRLG